MTKRLRVSDFRAWVARVGEAAAGRRLGVKAATIKRWNGHVPKSNVARAQKAIARSEAARKSTRTKKRKQPRGREAREDKKRIRELEKRLERVTFEQMDYWDRIYYEIERHELGLVPYRTLKAIAKLYGLPLRQVYHDYVSPKLRGKAAA